MPKKTPPHLRAHRRQNLAPSSTNLIPTPLFRRLFQEDFQDAQGEYSENEDGDQDSDQEGNRQSTSRNRRDTQQNHQSPHQQSNPRRGKQLPIVTNPRRRGKQLRPPKQQVPRVLDPTFSTKARNNQHLPTNSNNEGHNNQDLDDMSSSSMNESSDEESEQSVASLRRQLRQANKQLKAYKGSGKVKKKSERKDDMERLIKNTIRNVLWRTVKFLTHTTQKMEISERVRSMLELEEHEGDSPAAVAARENWLRVYSCVVTSEINKCRSYVIGRIRDAVGDYRDAHDGKFYSVKELRKCSIRKINTVEEEEMFVFYIDKLLPRATGNTDHWGLTKRCFETPSMCAFPEDPEKLFVPPSTEGFLMVVLEGYWLVWEKQWNYKKLHGKKAELPCPRGTKEKPLTDDDKLWLSKYTNMDAGQREFGGWKTTGINRFVEYTGNCKKSRAVAKAATVEAKALPVVRANNKITVATLAEYTDKKRKSPTTVAEEMEAIVTYGDEK